VSWAPTITGLDLVASAVATPSDLLGPDHRLDNAAVWGKLFGAEAPAVRARLGWAEDHPERFGVHVRHWAAWPGLAPRLDAVDLAAHAVALLDTGDCDLLVLASSTPARITRSDAHASPRRPASACAAWDVRGGGAGGLLAVMQAAQAVAGGARAAIVVAVEVASPYLRPDTPALGLLYGDAAVAMRFEPGPASLTARAGHATVPGAPFTVPGPLPPTPDGRYAARAPDAAYSEALRAVWSQTGEALAALGPVDALAPYGVTRGQVVRLHAQVPADLVVSSLPTHGCVGCAGALLAWHQARVRGARRIGTAAVGGGVSWAAARWESP
jgi:3-oxoacyl-[acyl-carrier-protein] synthase III